MSLVQFAHNKDAVSFQKALHEKLEAKIQIALDEVKIEVAGKLLGEAPTGLDNSSEGGESTMAAGGLNGKNRLPDTTDIKSTAPGLTKTDTKLPSVSKMPSPASNGKPVLPESAEPNKPEPHEQHQGSKGKRALRMALKKKYDKRQRDESVLPQVPSLDEKMIQAGSVDHMAHAVHSCASGHCPIVSHRGTFTHYDHPNYAIHKDHGGINPDKAEHNYYVAGAGGLHHFSVNHGRKGIDVKHVKKVS
jgi:hypothetical protein